MATVHLNKCRKCGEEFSKNETQCPKCGTTVSSSNNIVVAVAIAVIAYIVWQILAPSENSSSDLAEKQLKAELKAADDKKWKLVFAGEEMLKKTMRNPDSLIFERVLYTDDESVCYEYRGKNGFGGMSKGSAVFSNKGFITNEANGFQPIWSEKCAGKNGEEVNL